MLYLQIINAVLITINTIILVSYLSEVKKQRVSEEMYDDYAISKRDYTAFDERINNMKQELDTKEFDEVAAIHVEDMPLRHNYFGTPINVKCGSTAQILNPDVHNLPHDSVPVEDDDFPSVEIEDEDSNVEIAP